jgi:hypothetical protein
MSLRYVTGNEQSRSALSLLLVIYFDTSYKRFSLGILKSAFLICDILILDLARISHFIWSI